MNGVKRLETEHPVSRHAKSLLQELGGLDDAAVHRLIELAEIEPGREIGASRGKPVLLEVDVLAFLIGHELDRPRIEGHRPPVGVIGPLRHAAFGRSARIVRIVRELVIALVALHLGKAGVEIRGGHVSTKGLIARRHSRPAMRARSEG